MAKSSWTPTLLHFHPELIDGGDSDAMLTVLARAEGRSFSLVIALELKNEKLFSTDSVLSL